MNAVRLFALKRDKKSCTSLTPSRFSLFEELGATLKSYSIAL
jgi:hypothetical protein